MTEDQLILSIRRIANVIRARGDEATDVENSASLALKRQLFDLRHPAPPPPPPPTPVQLWRSALRTKLEARELNLVEINELLRVGE